MMDAPRIDWSTAEVRGETLTVEIVGERPRGYKRSVEAVATLLGGGTPLSDVSLKKGVLSVDGALPGREDEIRFFLEAVVLQANADHDVTDEDDEDEPDAPDAHGDAQSEMTDRFRRFAEEESQ
jgi:hypothetical protein